MVKIIYAATCPNRAHGAQAFCGCTQQIGDYAVVRAPRAEDVFPLVQALGILSAQAERNPV
jgi:hypothetical protein